MTGSFISSLAALRAHQDWIDVIGNNLANSNTTGFKTSRATFSDLLNVTLRPGTMPSGAVGGTNPLQKGLGVQLASVDRTFTQGALNSTGRTFDLALLGRGFFALDTGSDTLYSRVGTFGLDASGNMVDLRSGYRVLDHGGQPFTIDTSTVVPPTITSRVGFSGNLPAVVTGPLAEVLETEAPFAEGTAAAVAGANSGPFVVPTGETWTLELVVNGTAPQEVSLAAGSYSAAQVADAINAQTDGLTAVASSGEVQLTSDRTGLVSTIRVNPGTTGKDLKGLIGLGDFAQGSEVQASLTTELNDLVGNVVDYQAGDEIQLSGTAADGTPVVASFVYGTDGTTLGDLVSFLDGQYPEATVELDPSSGRITVTADATGEAELTLLLSDATSSTGKSDWAASFFSVATNGTGPDQVTTSIEVFDSVGTPHVVTLDFERQDDGTWNLGASLPDAGGAVLAGTVTGLSFAEDGALQGPETATIQLQFDGLAAQTVTLDFGASGEFGGLTQFGSPASAVADFQDGSGPGELVNLLVGADGTIDGLFSNGETMQLGSVGIATFTNEDGLEEVGGSYLRAAANSGTRVFGAGLLAGAGEVVGGALEASNVDTASEFVHLIEAQRGFQANARVITVQDEILNELVNVI